MQALEASPLLPKPVPEIILLSHTSESGWLEMALTDEERNEHQYETLARVGTALNIPESVLKDAGGTVKPAVVRIRGCRIGIARKFLAKLKETLKNVSTIVAPKHFYFAGFWDKGGQNAARLEYLMYCFESYSKLPVGAKAPKTIPTRDVINTLKADHHLRVDGSPVPDGMWQEWFDILKIGKNVEVGKKYPANRISRTFRLPVAWNVSPSESDFEDGALEFRHEIFTKLQFDLGEGPTKGTATQRRDFVKSKLRDPATKKTFATCFDDHPWPIWERYLKVRYETFSSFDDFMAGFDWVYEVGAWFGMRHVYRVLVPITLPVASNILVANYYPVAEKPAHIGLIETDGAYFAVL